jgi:cbb3-type cytochrome oxidase subunit 3
LIIAFALISFVLKLISMISTIVIVVIIVGVVVSLIRRGRSKRKNTAA